MPKKTKSVFTIVLLFFFCRVLFSNAEVIDKIVVIINDEIITQGDLDRILLPIYEQYRTLYSGQELVEKIDEARRNVLQRLIQDKLLLSEAKKRELKVEDKEVKARIDTVRKRFSSEKEFELALAQESILLSELTKRFEERILVEKLIDMEIRRRVAISPSELVSFYESHKALFKEPKKAKVRSILIRTGEERREEEEALKLAKEILERLKAGGDFGLLAEEYSDGPYRERGGDMGWVKEGELMDELNELVFSLDENEISGILKTNLGFHIFKVEEKTHSKTMEFSEIKGQVEQILFNEKIEEELQKWIEKLRKDAYIEFR